MQIIGGGFLEANYSPIQLRRHAVDPLQISDLIPVVPDLEPSNGRY